MGKFRAKTKTQSHDGKKQPSSFKPPKLGQSFVGVKFVSIVSSFLQSPYKKYCALAIIVVVVAGLVLYLSQSWLVQSNFSQAKTYPKVSVFGADIGNLSIDQLDSRLAGLKSEFETHKITLINDKSQFVFDANKLGIAFDAKATSQAILRLNNLSFKDKYRLLTGGSSPVIVPVIVLDGKVCTETLSVIPAAQIDSKDALIYFDQVLKIKPDQSGTKFNATSTCKELPKKLATGSFVMNVSLDTVQANLGKSDLEPELSQIQSVLGKSLSLKSGSGSYGLDLTPDQLLALFEISKKDSEVQVGWSSSKLDELINNIAAKVDTNSSSPALGACQYLVSSGGSWLDKEATKKIFTDLGADSSRSYVLPITYHAPVIGNRTPVARGGKGTIYLTYDDGLTYGDRIMNYASCYGIKVTFFELGSRAGIDAVPLRRAIAEGHAVQSHGYEHAMHDYGQRSYDWQYNDINQSVSAIMNVTGVRPTYFRPPGGNRSASTYQAASANGVNLILWGDASRDSAPYGVTSSLTCTNVLAGAFNGASVLMHSTNQSTAEAVPCIVEELAARGYNMQALR